MPGDMSFDFTGKRVLITGVGRGIGRALAIAIAESGGEVYGLSRQKEHLDTLVAKCPRITTIQADLADWDATRAAIENVPALDGLVNNAGIGLPWQASVDVSKEAVDETLNVNVMAALNITQIVAKKMIAAGNGGSIVNVSSIAGLTPMRECLPYSMSKAALDMMTKQFALELGPHKVRVNSIHPTVVYTDMTRAGWSEGPHVESLKGQTPLGRFAEMQEIVGPIMYLLSDLSSMVTGTMNPVEGGLLSSISV